ncbi:glycosyltransferase family 92 protein [Planktothrix sp. FACHB-1365]|uniref:glycosyltransferase family 92 protein n=1 Tax=Planktothrix sp. FACHB-1365 TaxID=2692855 RepID=UPI0016866216|nr:glycosyltransferase family 92 protein [Planktothrix sp. FACHB-1365]MBD2484159.1 glycosyltransferase family 92 protein [Planktothrix sp. FACHB-1365]
MRFITKVNFNKNIEEADRFCKFDFDLVPEIIEEHLKLSGWVIGIESPAVGVELIQDGQLVGEAPLTIHRPRAAKIYATFPGAEQSGFIIDTTLEKINVESGHILIQAVLENFQRIPLSSLNLSQISVPSPPKKTFFIHVPKTAGSSFNKFLHTYLHGDSHCEAYLEVNQLWAFQNLDVLKSWDFISGHLNIQYFNRNFKKDNYLLVTLLRNPLDQLISHVNWLASVHQCDHNSRFYQSHPDYIKKMGYNLYEKDLKDHRDIVDFLLKYKLFKNSQSSFFQSDSNLDADQIIENLLDFDLVGLTEDYSQFLKNYITLIGLEPIVEPVIEQINVNSEPALNKKELLNNSNFVEFINDYNAVDIKVYNYFYELNKNRVDSFRSDDLSTDHKKNQKIELVLDKIKKSVSEPNHDLEESGQELTITKAELQNTREELERLQSQFDEVLSELEQAHWELHQTEQAQSGKAVSTLKGEPDLEAIKDTQILEHQELRTDKILLCAIAKNEAAYLVEWVAYHKFIIGFDQVLIYNNDSKDDSKLLLEQLDKLGICQYKYWPRSKGEIPQLTAYNDAIQTQSQSYKWVCFLDLDEFLVLKNFNSIHECIQSFENQADSIQINWLMFGSSGHSTYSPEPVIQRFTKCADKDNPNSITDNKHMKSISKIDSIESIDIHIPRLKPNSRYFHIDGTELHFGANPTSEHIKGQGYINHHPAQINHYQSKSLEEYKCRKLKGRATVDETSAQIYLKPGDFDRLNSYCNQIDNLDILATLSPLNHKIDSIYQALGSKEAYQNKFKKFIQSEAARYNSLGKSPTPINKSTMPKISKVPLWAPEAVGKISEFLMGRPGAKILEFGSGGSTIWLSSYDVELISIEHDQSWFYALQSKLEEQTISNVRLVFREKPYFRIADEFPDHHFDLILVDGRDRNDCIQASLKKVKNGGLLVLDDAQRTRYRMGRNLLEAFPSARYYHPQRYTQIWSIRHDLNCRSLAVDNPFEDKIERVVSEQSVSSDWERIFEQNPIRLYAGSLSKQAKEDGWIGLALDKSDQWHIKHDLTQPFPIGDGVVDCFQAEDVIEHIEPADLLSVTFPEIYRVMKPGGFIRISLPDYRCDYLIDRCWKNEQGDVYYDPLGGGKWDAKLKRVTPGGHIWFPTYERLRSLIELSPLRHCKADWLHYYDVTGQPVIHDIDYSKGYIMRTPDHDRRVQNPRRPLSIVVDLYKD